MALITGASGGIGEAVARILASEGSDVVLVARSRERLEAVAASIRSGSGRMAEVIVADLARRDAGVMVEEALRERDLTVRDLVNNAGYGLSGDILDLPLDDQLGIVDVNCAALLDFTRRFLPQIRENRGGILNVASVASFTAGPGLAVYYASKAFVLSLARALRHEVAPYGVTVTTVCPGPTDTGFGARAGFSEALAGGLLVPMSAFEVASAAIAGYRRGRAVVVPGVVNKVIVALLRIMPPSIVLPLLSRIQRRRRISASAA